MTTAGGLQKEEVPTAEVFFWEVNGGCYFLIYCRGRTVTSLYYAAANEFLCQRRRATKPSCLCVRLVRERFIPRLVSVLSEPSEDPPTPLGIVGWIAEAMPKDPPTPLFLAILLPLLETRDSENWPLGPTHPPG